jgi:hypothetical protein
MALQLARKTVKISLRLLVRHSRWQEDQQTGEKDNKGRQALQKESKMIYLKTLRLLIRL